MSVVDGTKFAAIVVLRDVREEVDRADANWPDGYHSAHEALGVLLEEVHEFTEHVYKKQRDRNLVAMRKELIQIAAVCVRAARDVCSEDRGRI